jgi:hypothetical protein
MSKKLIAVASAAALALSVLTVMPAAATGIGAPTVDDASSTATGTTVATAFVNTLPSTNAMENSDADNETTNTAVRFTYAGLTAGKAITITAEGGVKLSDETSTAATAAGRTLRAATALTTISVPVAVGGAATFFASATTYSAGKVTVQYEGTTNIYYVKAKKDQALMYSIKSVTYPSALGASQKGSVDVVITDVFGNEVKQADDTDTAALTTQTLTMDILGNATPVTNATTFKWKKSVQAWRGEITADADGGPINMSVTLGGTIQGDASASGFAEPVTVNYGGVTATDLTAIVATLRSQVAALTTQVAARVSKKKYNTLARKWNAAFPSQKVALKK